MHLLAADSTFSGRLTEFFQSIHTGVGALGSFGSIILAIVVSVSYTHLTLPTICSV